LAALIEFERVVGASVQRRNFTSGVTALGAILIIPARTGFKIWVRSTQVEVTPSGATVPQYEIRAGAAPAGAGSGSIITHFRNERNNSGLSLGDTILERVYPSFGVDQAKRDYLVELEVFAGAVMIKLNVDAFYIPGGVNGKRF